MTRAMKNSGYDWIGQVPDSWLVLPAQRGFTEIKRKNTDGAVQKALQFKFGTIIPKANFDADSDDYVADTITAYTVVEPGTVMINGLNLNYDFKTQRSAIVKETGVITSAYLALWPDPDMITSEFATYLFKGYETKMALHNMGSGIRLTLGWKEFKKQPVLYPPIAEQQQIVTFLDRKCAEIDSVIADTQRTIEEYKSLKQSIITEAVTKGVCGKRIMKDSGIEWIGEIPDTWSIIPHKYVMHKQKVLCEHYNGENIISLSMDGVKIRDLDAGGKMPTTFDGYQYVEPDDLLLCLFDIDVTPRCVGIVKDAGLTSPAYSRFKVHSGYLNRYYDYLLRFIDDKKVLVHLAKNLRSSLTETDFGAIRTIVPPYEEQVEIADYLDKKVSEIDALIVAKQQLLSELESYKKSVIYEYVTGKKEVPACQ